MALERFIIIDILEREEIFDNLISQFDKFYNFDISKAPTILVDQ